MPNIDRWWNWANSLSLWVKIMGIAVGMAILVGLLSSFQAYHYASKNLNEQLKEKSLAIAREQAAHAEYYLLVNDLLSLTESFKNIKKNRPDVRYIIIQGQQGEILAHSFKNGFPADLITNTQNATPNESTVIFQTEKEMIWESTIPVMGGKLGSLRVGITDLHARPRVYSLIHSLALGTIGVIILAILLSIILTGLITKPIDRLSKATCAIRKGDYNTIVNYSCQDEVGNLIEAFNIMAAQLKRAAKERLQKDHLRSNFITQIIATQEEERKRIARELHDQTGQALVSFMLMLKMLEQANSQEEINNGIKQLKVVLSEEMENIHHMAIELRPSVLDDMGIEAAIGLYVDQFKQKHNIDIKLTIIGFDDNRPAPHVEISIYRIIQEALINVLRHAKAKKIKIILEWRDTDIRGIVEDDGVGFNTDGRDKGRLGLYGMEERSRLLGGTFRIESEPEGGTLVLFSIPFEQDLAEDKKP
ncbi:MAG: histidine kinase [Desulfobulbaceae bacterium]|nr:histidine kinase [Desulfobulbaceae bacterium]HIJ78116.1 HAMP domain-containing protein [Deltaproteobacteria bacterium]